ncbi:MAG TPA: M1 family metallopeptidase [Vicinamibacterales bacterium]|jgi:aminopeptidase N
MSILRQLGTVVSFAACCLIATAAVAERLPLDVIPLHYQLTLAPDFTTTSFDGDLTIDLRVDKATNKIVLNAVDLEVYDAIVLLPYDRTLTPTVSTDPPHQTVTFTTPRKLSQGTIKLQLRYGGRLNSELRGFYLSRANGKKYAITQFEATDARRAFPCFDEPAVKASFTIAAVVDEHDTAISNGPLLSDTPGPKAGKHTLKFSTTQKMPSYLAALAVGDFACVEGGADSIPIRVCTTPDRRQLGRFALDAAENVLRFYNHYFSIRYPFRKLDLVAVPDFDAGAMENTGAIFFREQDLLLDEATATQANQVTVASVIAHEIAHQWFGDLVTMRWWDDLWLNEGFATWMASKPLVAWKPQWHAELADIAETGRVMDLDTLRSARAIRTTLTTPAEIDEAFDAFAYSKAGAILRMVESDVGADAFRAGVNAYLRAHAYGSATSEDFWNELARTSGRPADRVMARFIDQSGVPVVSVASGCDGTDRTVVDLAQRRFAVEAPSRPVAGGGWQIPIGLRSIDDRSASTSTTPLLLSAARQTATIPGCAPLIFANAGARGYYRVSYTAGVVSRLAAVARERLTPAERLRLIDDEWALARAGTHGPGDYLGLVGALAGDATPEVLEEAADGLAFLHDRVVADNDRAMFEGWVRTTFAPVLASLGWSPAADDSGDRLRLRAVVLGIVGEIGRDPEVATKARQMLTAHLDGSLRLDPSLLEVVIRLAASGEGADLFARVQDAANTAPPAIQTAMRLALARGQDPTLVGRLLASTLSDEVRGQDVAPLLAVALENPSARNATWSFVTSRWAEVARKAGQGSALSVIAPAAGSFCDSESRDRVQKFFGAMSQGSRSLQLTLERIDACRDTRLRLAGRLKDWLTLTSAPTRQDDSERSSATAGRSPR